VKVLGIIPARYSSSRFPGKPLIDLKGKSMIQRVYEGTAKSSLIDQLIVATDDERIYDHVKSFGGKVMMTSSDHTTGTDRCGEVAHQFPDYDVIINIQGDEPLVDYHQLEELIQLFENPNTQIGTLGIQLTDKADLTNENRIKIVLNHKNQALYFSRSAIPNNQKYKGNAFLEGLFLRHIGLYGFRRDILMELINLKITSLETIESLEQLRWLYYGYIINVAKTTIETPNIDSPEDIELVLKFIS
jgi:3-deoxy-manno-octulosonate cytidylyltransferase (CMP-KDO synthetase)